MRAFPLHDTGKLPKPSPCPAYAPEGHKESSDDYRAVIVRLNTRWRVIECKDSIQWILQRVDGERHGRARWTGRSYCRTRDSLLRACRDNAGEIDAIAVAALESLPNWIGGQP